MASYNVNYNDDRFTQVENEKQSELEKYNQKYDDLINERNTFTQQQQDYVDKWQATQEQIANDNLNHQIELYNQEKDKANEEYQKEAKASYIDYQKEVDKYGVSRENVVANGLSNSGYAESSKVGMYNAYQNRLASARSSLKDAQLEFDNAIKEAQLSNNATLAENALKALEQKLDIALEGFNYKTEQENNRLNWDYNINNTYYNRYQDVEDQINYENEQAEAIRQYNEQMAYQKEQQRLEQERWEQEMAYQKQQDAIANAQKWASINASYSSGSPSSSGGFSLTNGGGVRSSSSGSNNSSTVTYGGKTGYNSLADAVLYLKNNGVSGVSTATNKEWLIAKGYITTQTINGKMYYFPNPSANTKSSSSSSKKSSKSILQSQIDTLTGKKTLF